MGTHGGKKKFSGARVPMGASVKPESAKEEVAPNWKGHLTEEELAKEEKKEAERNMQAQKAQEKHRLDCERKAAEERKQRIEELRWHREKKKLLTPESGVLTATYQSSDQNCVGCSPCEWILVHDKYYCQWCDKHLNDNTLESHVDGKAHIKNAEWKQTQGTSSCSTGEDPDYSEDWFKHVVDEWGGHIVCLACNKCVDVVHVQTASHISRVNAWKESKELKVQPIEEWLMYVFWFPDCTEEYDMGVKCLLCDKFCQDLYSHGDNPEHASKEHKKRLHSYGDYVDDLRRRREDYIRGDKTGLIREICGRQTCALRGPSGYRSALKAGKSQALRSNKQKHADSSVFQNQKPQGRRNLAPPTPQTCYTPPCRSSQQPRPLMPPNVPSSNPAPRAACSQFEDNSAVRTTEMERNDESYNSFLHNARQQGHVGYRVTTAYDAVETTMDGEAEGGYLPLRYGEVITLPNGAVASGEKHNNYKKYGFCTNMDGSTGWCPMECVERIPG